MNPPADGLRAGTRIRLLRAGHWEPPLEPEAQAVLDAAVGHTHALDSVDEDGHGWLALEAGPDHWHTFKLYPNDYEILD